MAVQRRYRIGALHALANAIPPTQDAFDRVWPEADVAHLLDGSLYLDRNAGTADDAELAARIYLISRFWVTSISSFISSSVIGLPPSFAENESTITAT